MYVGCTKNFCLMDYAKVFTLSFLSPVKLYINSYFKKYMRCSVKTFSSRLLLIARSFYVRIYNAERRVTYKMHPDPCLLLLIKTIHWIYDKMVYYNKWSWKSYIRYYRIMNFVFCFHPIELVTYTYPQESWAKQKQIRFISVIKVSTIPFYFWFYRQCFVS